MSAARKPRGAASTLSPDQLYGRALMASTRAMTALDAASRAAEGEIGRHVRCGMLSGLLRQTLAQCIAAHEAEKRAALRPEGASAAAFVADGGRA